MLFGRICHVDVAVGATLDMASKDASTVLGVMDSLVNAKSTFTCEPFCTVAQATREVTPESATTTLGLLGALVSLTRGLLGALVSLRAACCNCSLDIKRRTAASILEGILYILCVLPALIEATVVSTYLTTALHAPATPI